MFNLICRIIEISCLFYSPFLLCFFIVKGVKRKNRKYILKSAILICIVVFAVAIGFFDHNVRPAIDEKSIVDSAKVLDGCENGYYTFELENICGDFMVSDKNKLEDEVFFQEDIETYYNNRNEELSYRWSVLMCPFEWDREYYHYHFPCPLPAFGSIIIENDNKIIKIDYCYNDEKGINACIGWFASAGLIIRPEVNVIQIIENSNFNE